MFHFPGCPPHELFIHSWVTGHYPSRVPPFGYPRIYAYLRLPWAFRSLSRPSSAISALASSLRSFSLDLPAGSRAPSALAASSLLPLRYVHLPKTIEKCSYLFFRFLLSLCSFQGAASPSAFPSGLALASPSVPASSCFRGLSFQRSLKTIQ